MKDRIHLFEDRSAERKVFHYVLGSGTVKTGRESTLCDLETGAMRKAAPFRPGDGRGAVHFLFGCPDCIDLLTDLAG